MVGGLSCLVGTSVSPLLTGRLAAGRNLPTWAQPGGLMAGWSPEAKKKKNCCGLHGETQARHRLGGHLSRLIDRSMNAAEKHVD
jgi:hypothetical protein